MLSNLVTSIGSRIKAMKTDKMRVSLSSTEMRQRVVSVWSALMMFLKHRLSFQVSFSWMKFL